MLSMQNRMGPRFRRARLYSLILPSKLNQPSVEVQGKLKLQKNYPKYLNLLQIRQPTPAVVSLLHRISGALMYFPGIPTLLYCLEMVLSSPEKYAQLQSILTSPLAKTGLLISLWFFVHHFFAGIRFVALDLHYGIELQQARRTSKIVLVAGAATTFIAGISIW
jgi:succinate dehydrogenase / fumarate reductase cytochrome b subunit